MSSDLDDRLSNAQLVLRDGHHDELSRAIAVARDILSGKKRASPQVRTTHTHTYAVLEVSIPSYNEMKKLLGAAGYDHAFQRDGSYSAPLIDMHGIALSRAEPTRTREGDQALPESNDLPAVQDLVLADIEARKAIGIQRYGQLLKPHDGRDNLRDLYEELMDGAMYARKALYERDGK